MRVSRPALPYRRILTVTVALMVSVAAVLAADFLVALVWKPSGATIVKPYIAKDDGWYELAPSFVGKDQFGPYIYDVETDAHGFRKKPGATVAAPYDMIFLGDSFTYGMNGAWDDTFVGMYAGDSGHQAVNAGVSSYSPTGYLYQYQRALAAGLLPRGHRVVIAVDVSDVQDEAGIWVDGDAHPRKRSAAAPRVVTAAMLGTFLSVDSRGRLIERFPRTFLIYRYLRYDVLGWNRASVTEMPRSAFTFADWPTLDARPADPGLAGFAPLGVRGGLDRVEQKLLAIMQLARAHDAEVSLLIYPWPAQVAHADAFSWSTFVAGACEKGSCAGVIDTIPRFRSLAANDSNWLNTLYVSGDTHFTALGNRVIADALLKALPKN